MAYTVQQINAALKLYDKIKKVVVFPVVGTKNIVLQEEHVKKEIEFNL